jgi:Tfp pilus assembly protein PilW
MSNEKGFTVVELLIAAALTSLLMVAVLTIFQQGQMAYLFGAGRAEVQQTARGTLDQLVRELRTGRGVSAATVTSITFQFVDDTGTTVTVQYSLNGTNLQRNQTVPVLASQPEVVMGGVNALAFTYYDANNVVTTNAANVRSVNIKLTTRPQDISIAAYSPANQNAILEDRVRLRNLL